MRPGANPLSSCVKDEPRQARGLYLVRVATSISGFAISNSGALTPIPGTVVGIDSSGSTNLDIAVSADGKFLYSLNAGNGSIGVFAIQPVNGTLTNLGALGGLPAAAGLNGIAAN